MYSALCEPQDEADKNMCDCQPLTGMQYFIEDSDLPVPLPVSVSGVDEGQQSVSKSRLPEGAPCWLASRAVTLIVADKESLMIHDIKK